MAPKDLGEKSCPENLLRSDALYSYILETSVYPREHECMKELREMTYHHKGSYMMTAPDEGQFIGMLLKLMNAKNTIEIGVYTGYSLLATALALPEDGKVVAIDPNRECYELGLPFIEKAGVLNMIDYRQSPALPVLEEMREMEKCHGKFDFVFVDADKDNYLNYHELLQKLVRVGGLIAYDNTLWKGTVVGDSQGRRGDTFYRYRDCVVELNKALAADPRVEICQLSVGDGITLCRRL